MMSRKNSKNQKNEKGDGDFVDEADKNFRVSIDTLKANKKLMRKSKAPVRISQNLSSKSSIAQSEQIATLDSKNSNGSKRSKRTTRSPKPLGVDVKLVGNNYSEELYQKPMPKPLANKGATASKRRTQMRNSSAQQKNLARQVSIPENLRSSKKSAQNLLILPDAGKDMRPKDDDLLSYNPFEGSGSESEGEPKGKLILPKDPNVRKLQADKDDDLMSYNPFRDSASESGGEEPNEKQMAEGIKSMQIEKERELKSKAKFKAQQQRISARNSKNLTRALGTKKYNPFAYVGSGSEQSEGVAEEPVITNKKLDAMVAKKVRADPKLTYAHGEYKVKYGDQTTEGGSEGMMDEPKKPNFLMSGMFANFSKPSPAQAKGTSLPSDLKSHGSLATVKDTGCLSFFKMCFGMGLKVKTYGSTTMLIDNPPQMSLADQALQQSQYAMAHHQKHGIASFLELSGVENGTGRAKQLSDKERNSKKRVNFFRRMRNSTKARSNSREASSIRSGIPNKTRMGRMESYLRHAVEGSVDIDSNRQSLKPDATATKAEKPYCGICNKRIRQRDQRVEAHKPNGAPGEMIEYHADCVKCDICKMTLGPEKVLEIRRDGGFLLCLNCSLNVVSVRKAHENMQKDTEGSMKYHKDLIPEGYLRFVKVEVANPNEKPVIGLIPMCSRCGGQLMVSDKEVMAEGAERYHKSCPPESLLKLKLGEDIRRVALGFPKEIPIKINVYAPSLANPVSNLFFLQKDEEFFKEQRNYLIQNQDAPIDLSLVFRTSAKTQSETCVELNDLEWDQVKYECEIREDVGPFIIGDRLAEQQFTKESPGTFSLKGMFEHGFCYDVVTNLKYDTQKNSVTVMSVEFKCSLPKL